MLCDMCKKNEAVFHTKVIRNGIVKERHLCEQCSKKYREEDGFSQGIDPVGDLFSSLSGLMFGGGKTVRHTVCKMCGTTSDEFLRTGYVGCPECYKAFENEVMPAIKRTQHDVRHVGKIPGGGSSDAAIRSEIEKLRIKQRRAAEAEDYEQAGELRDRINALKASLENGGSDK